MKKRTFTLSAVIVLVLLLFSTPLSIKASSVGNSYGDFLSPKEDGEQVKVGVLFTIKYEANYHNGNYGNRTHHCNIRIKDPDGTIVLDDDYIYTKGSTVESSFTPEKEGVYTIREQCYFAHPAGGNYVGDDKTITICAVKELASETETAEPSPADSSAAVYSIGSLKYTVNKNQATIVSPKNKNSTKLTIPATVKVEGKSVPVTTIAQNSFNGMKKLKTVTIGKNIKTIGKNAFRNCKKLKTITIKTSKLASSKVGSNAFKGIYSKATIKVPKKKLTTYKKLLKKKGIGRKVKITK